MAELSKDVAEARDRMRIRVGGNREIRRLERYLHNGEIVECMTTGSYGGGIGLVVLTNSRLLFVHDGIMSQSTEDFPLSKISSVQWTSKLFFGIITIFVSSNKAVISSVQKNDGKDMVDMVRNNISGAPIHESSPKPSGSSAGIEQLKQLGELHAAGVLSDREFYTKKAEILARL